MLDHESGSELPFAGRPPTALPSRHTLPVRVGGAMRSVGRNRAHRATMTRRAGVAKTEGREIVRFGPQPDGSPTAALGSSATVA